MIFNIPPPASDLNWTKENDGSTPVVSHAMTKPIVPVGAITVVCAFLNPNSVPKFNALSHVSLAASNKSSGHNSASIPNGLTERESYSFDSTS